MEEIKQLLIKKGTITTEELLELCGNDKNYCSQVAKKLRDEYSVTVIFSGNSDWSEDTPIVINALPEAIEKLKR